jgi:hypothetical protein
MNITTQNQSKIQVVTHQAKNPVTNQRKKRFIFPVGKSAPLASQWLLLQMTANPTTRLTTESKASEITPQTYQSMGFVMPSLGNGY